MKRLISLIITAALMLTLASCAQSDVQTDEPEAARLILDAFSGSTCELSDGGGIDYGSLTDWSISLPGGETVFLSRYESEDAAREFSSYYSDDGSDIAGDVNVTVDYVAPVHLWLHGDCIVRYCGSGDTALKLREIFGEQFAGQPFDEKGGEALSFDADVLSDKVTALSKSLNDAGVENVRAETLFFYPASDISADAEYADSTPDSDGEPLFEQPTQGAAFEFVPVATTVLELSDGTNIYADCFASEEEAEKHASNFSEDGLSYSYSSEDGTMTDSELSPDMKIHYWRDGAVVYTYSGYNNVAASVSEILGEQFAGSSYSDFSDIGSKEVRRFAQYLDTFDAVGSVVKEDASQYAQYDYINTATESYVIELDGGATAYLRVYASPEEAANEASQYDPDDPSVYGKSIVDYATPVHFWLSGDTIIELGSWDGEDAKRIADYYGEQFTGDAYDSSNEQDIPTDGDILQEEKNIPFEYTDSNLKDIDADLPEPAVVNSYDELKKYREAAASGGAEEISELLEEYGESSFEGASLILIPVCEGTVSERHEVKSVTLYGNILTVETVNYGTGDTALDRCLIVIKTEKLPDGIELKINEETVGGPKEEPVTHEDIFGMLDCEYEDISILGSDTDSIDAIPETAFIDSEESLENVRKRLGGVADHERLDKALEVEDGYFDSNTIIILKLEEPNISEGHQLVSAVYDGHEIKLTVVNSAGYEDAEECCIMVIKIKQKLTNSVISVVRSDVYKAAGSSGFTASYIRTDGSYGANLYPKNTVITSRSELESYYSRMAPEFFRTDGFEEEMKNYPEEWFENNTLVILAREVGSGSIRFKVLNAEVAGNSVSITLETLVPEIGTDDMAGWQIMIGLNGVKLTKDAEIAVSDEASGGKTYEFRKRG